MQKKSKKVTNQFASVCEKVKNAATSKISVYSANPKSKPLAKTLAKNSSKSKLKINPIINRQN
jgi:hypothetical protein